MDRVVRNLLHTKAQVPGQKSTSNRMPTKTSLREGERMLVIVNGKLREYIKFNNILWYSEYTSTT